MSKRPITVFLEGSWQKQKKKDEIIRSVNLILTVWDLSHSSPHLVLHGLVDPVDQPGEGLSIDGFGQSISGIDGMIDCEWAEDLYVE